MGWMNSNGRWKADEEKRAMMMADVKRLSEAERVDGLVQLSRRQQALLSGAAEDGQKRRWTILKVLHRRDNDVDNLLSRALIEHWLPLRKADENANGRRRSAAGTPVWVLAWPGYIFVKIPDTADAWHAIRAIKHVKSVLSVGERAFFFDDNKFMKLKAELATLKPSSGPETMYVEGEPVLVNDGPFASFPATVESVIQDGAHQGRARVEVMIFGRAVPVELDLAQLSKR
jgi:transcription termination/antitermination protein NusG